MKLSVTREGEFCFAFTKRELQDIALQLYGRAFHKGTALWLFRKVLLEIVNPNPPKKDGN